MSLPTGDRLDPLRLDIDIRIRDIWQYAYAYQEASKGKIDLDAIGALMRAAYGHGYYDALTEPVVAQLHLDHGYKVPRRRGR